MSKEVQKFLDLVEKHNIKKIAIDDYKFKEFYFGGVRLRKKTLKQLIKILDGKIEIVWRLDNYQDPELRKKFIEEAKEVK